MTRSVTSATTRRRVGDKRNYGEIHRTLTMAFETLLGIPARKVNSKRLNAKAGR